jgi:hypothetical protein
MTNFSDLGITSVLKRYEGEKIKIKKLLNVPIQVTGYKIVDSKFTDKGSGKCMNLELIHENQPRLLFTGSIGLMSMIEQVPIEKFPVDTTIVEVGDGFEFK